MISLEETAKDTTLDSKNLTLVHKQIILSIRAIDWEGLFSYTLRDSFTAENLELDYSGLLSLIKKLKETDGLSGEIPLSGINNPE